MPSRAAVDITDKLMNDISDEVGNQHTPELDIISDNFNKTLAKALSAFNSSVFDDDGFVSKTRDLYLTGDKKDQAVIKNIMNSLQSEFISPETMNQNEMLLKRDIDNVCAQMPEMRDAVYVVRDAIIECNVATGQVSRTLSFENREKTESEETNVQDLENKHDLMNAIKNFIVPNTLKAGEFYVHIVPYSKLFAELNELREQGNMRTGKAKSQKTKNGSINESGSLMNAENIKVLTESASHITKIDAADINKIDNNIERPELVNPEDIAKTDITHILESISIYNSSSILATELGVDGLKDLLLRESKERITKPETTPDTHFMETMNYGKLRGSIFNDIDQDNIDVSEYKDIKGCYVKYLDPLRVIPIRMDRRVIGYYYVSTSTDGMSKPTTSSGVVDLSFQQYTHDRNFVDNLANMIIQSFDKKMLEKNIKLKNEIVDVIMAHKFSEGKLSFIYIPENEIVRFVINEDENGRGHSMIEPGIYPARMYLLLSHYNMIYTLNNNTTRIHYLKSSGLDKNYVAQVQRAIRKFQSKRITMNDLFSYTTALPKIGGMGEMVLPAGRGDYKAFETDTIDAVQNPIDVNFLEQLRRQALSATGAPHLLIINALDEVDFAKTVELANARFLSTVSSYKIDFNKGLTKFYQLLMKYETNLAPEVIQSFMFKFDTVKQQDLAITSEMISNFNTYVELVMNIYYSKSEMEDDKGNPSNKQMHLRRELAKENISQLNFDNLEKIINKVETYSTDDATKDKVRNINITDEDLDDVKK